MSLTAADVAEIMRLVEQSSFDELILEMDGVKLALRRNGAGVSADGAFSAAGAASPASGATAREASPAAGGGLAPGTHVGVARGVSPHNAPAGGSTTSHSQAGADGARSSSASGAPAVAAPSDPNVSDVPAPLLGTFYRAPKPGAPPFVDVGATVEEDTVVGIIEVMKLMNTVRAGVRGTVTEILGKDGVLVEYGETILRVRKAG